MRIVAALAPIALACVALAAACSDEEIVLATVPIEDDAGAAGTQTFVRCIDNDDCPTNEFCDLDPDRPVPSGHCRHKPEFCENEKRDPVCGRVTGITYLNDCYRRRAGESSKIDGECEDDVARSCDLAHPCPLHAVCELLGGGKPSDKLCGAPSGHCWGVATCPDDDRGFRWDECSTETGAMRCVTTCTAIQTGRPFTEHEGPCP